ncbi:MFS transporter [Streptomyces sp. NPDC014801]|uniref:MFS transporter n=1 Tax=Streptomyces sp. NPDC014801 TaxID=3364916 RepID=UPI0036F59520
MRTTDPPASPLCREVRDRRGRVYRVGERDADLLGRARIWMVVLPWAGMAGISWAGAACLAARPGALHVWVLAQAAVAFPAGRLRESGRLPAGRAVTAGALGVLAACVTLTGLPGPALADGARLAVAGAVGGAGAGLVVAVCLTLPGRWYPERRGGPAGWVVSGCAAGAVPFLLGLRPAGLAVTGAGACLAVAAAGRLLRDPPRDWWPPHSCPLRVPADPLARRVRVRNPPAVRQHTPAEAARSPVLWLTGLCLLGAAAVVVLDLRLPVPPAPAGLAAGGAAVAAAGAVSDLLGRRATLVAACLVLGAAQFVLAAGAARPPLVAGVAVGLAGGAVLALVTAMTADHFGENHSASVHGLLAAAWALPVLCAPAVRTPHGALLPAGCAGLLCAALALFLKAPGRLIARRVLPNPHPLGEEMA